MQVDLTPQEINFLVAVLGCCVSGVVPPGSPFDSYYKLQKLASARGVEIEKGKLCLLLHKESIKEGVMNEGKSFIHFPIRCGNINYNDVVKNGKDT